jgi:hypothetical protein
MRVVTDHPAEKPPVVDEAQVLSEALVAVRRAAVCESISSPVRRALETVGQMLERNAPSRSLQVHLGGES